MLVFLFERFFIIIAFLTLPASSGERFGNDTVSFCLSRRSIAVAMCSRLAAARARVADIGRYLQPALTAGSVMLRPEVRGSARTCYKNHQLG